MSSQSVRTVPRPDGPSLFRRAVAHSLDRTFFWVLTILPLVIVSVFADVELENPTLGPTEMLLGIMIAAPFYILAARKGTTPGKRMLRLYVVKVEDGALASAGTILFRETIAKLISCLVLGYFWPLFDAYDRTAHDRMMGTMVVYSRKEKGK